MKRYDPGREPDPAEWLAMDEDDRIDLVMGFHRRARIRLPNPHIHAAIHVVVENQAAMGPRVQVRRALERLQREGLDRHDAVHAVGSVLAEHLMALMEHEGPLGEPNARYGEALKALTAERWRRSG